MSEHSAPGTPPGADPDWIKQVDASVIACATDHLVDDATAQRLAVLAMLVAVTVNQMRLRGGTGSSLGPLLVELAKRHPEVTLPGPEAVPAPTLEELSVMLNMASTAFAEMNRYCIRMEQEGTPVEALDVNALGLYIMSRACVRGGATTTQSLMSALKAFRVLENRNWSALPPKS